MTYRSRKGQMMLMQMPWLILLVLAGIVLIALLAYVKTANLIYSDKSRLTSDALYVMLSSNLCTPNTKLPLRDVIGYGIGEGKKMDTDTIIVTNGLVSDSLDIKTCLNRLWGTTIPGIPGEFYVVYSKCPAAPTGCFHSPVTPPSTSSVPLTAESDQYVALPDGGAAKVVLKTGW